MRILIATVGYPPQVGGIESVTHNLAAQYVRLGHEVAVVAPEAAGLPSRTEVGGVTVVRLPFPMPQRSARELLGFVCRFPAADLAFRRLVARFRPDVLNSHFAAATNSLYSVRAAARFRLPLVVSLHGGDVETMPARRSSWRLAALAAISKADALTTCSDYLRRRAGRISTKALAATVVRNGVDLDEFEPQARPTEEQPVFLGIGRFVQEKGFDLALDAFCQVAKVSPEVDLMLIGSGPEEQSLRAQAGRLGVAHKVAFLPPTPRSLVVNALRTCMAVIVPSRREALGIVNLEAMAAGKPVVAAEVGGIPEVIRDGENGLLVPPENADALAAAMLELAADPELRRKLGSAGRALALQRHSWSAAASAFLQCYCDAIRLKQARQEVRS